MFGDHIYSKKPESSDSMYSSILILEKIWYHHFTKSGPNFGSPATHNWNKIHKIFSSKSGHQKYSVWVPGDPTQSCFAVWCQIFWTKLLHLSVFLVKQYASFIYVKRMSFCLVNWAFPFVGSRGPISCRKVGIIFHAYEGYIDENRRGPNIEHCDTPVVILSYSLNVLFTFTLCFLFVK